MRMFLHRTLVLTACGLSGCASLAPERLPRDVGQLVQEKSGVMPTWRPGAIERARVDEYLKAGLTADDAVAVALLASPDLQAEFERLGLARAEFLESSTLPNPVLGWSRLTERGGPGSTVEWSVLQNIAHLIWLPLERRAADRELDAARFEAARALLAHLAAVRAAWLEAKAGEQVASFSRDRADLARLEAELMERYVRAGNEPQRELHEKRLEQAEWQREAAAADEAALAARERLGRLIGVSDAAQAWQLRGEFAALPETEADLEKAEFEALQHRPDLLAARRRVESRLAHLSAARGRRVLPDLEASWTRETDDGERRQGPGLELELPLFSAPQLALARSDAQARLALREAQSLALAVRAEVREARMRLANARAAWLLARGTELPAAESAAEIRQREFFYMLIGPFDAMRARGDALLAQRGLVEATRDYWRARLALTQAAALPLQSVREWVAP